MTVADWRLFKSLTPRQRQFLKLIAKRRPLEEIANELGVTVIGAKRIQGTLEKLSLEHRSRWDPQYPDELCEYAKRFGSANYMIFETE